MAVGQCGRLLPEQAQGIQPGQHIGCVHAADQVPEEYPEATT